MPGFLRLLDFGGHPSVSLGEGAVYFNTILYFGAVHQTNRCWTAVFLVSEISV